MTTEESIRLYEEAEKYSDGLPAEERSAERTVGFYDCLCRNEDKATAEAARNKENAIAFLKWYRHYERTVLTKFAGEEQLYETFEQNKKV